MRSPGHVCLCRRQEQLLLDPSLLVRAQQPQNVSHSSRSPREYRVSIVLAATVHLLEAGSSMIARALFTAYMSILPVIAPKTIAWRSHIDIGSQPEHTILLQTLSRPVERRLVCFSCPFATPTYASFRGLSHSCSSFWEFVARMFAVPEKFWRIGVLLQIFTSRGWHAVPKGIVSSYRRIRWWMGRSTNDSIECRFQDAPYRCGGDN